MRYGPNTPAITEFLERVDALSMPEWASASARWGGALDPDWFGSTSRVVEASRQANRREEEERLHDEAAAVIRRRWRREEEAGIAADAGAAAAAVYLVVTALLALLVRDRIAPEDFARLYEPFAGLIPIDTLPA
jgi:hypothetical protein